MLEGQMDPNTGKPVSVLKAYAKDMIVVLIVAPILLILATSGVLTTLGFKLAGFICAIINKVGASIG